MPFAKLLLVHANKIDMCTQDALYSRIEKNNTKNTKKYLILPTNNNLNNMLPLKKMSFHLITAESVCHLGNI